MKLLHNVMIKTHHVRTALQDIMKKPQRNEATATHNEEATQHNVVTTTLNEETTQNNDKKPHKKVMAFHSVTLFKCYVIDCYVVMLCY